MDGNLLDATTPRHRRQPITGEGLPFVLTRTVYDVRHCFGLTASLADIADAVRAGSPG